jgi:glycosyltransferase involved in cell wall biosynthesis
MTNSSGDGRSTNGRRSSTAGDLASPESVRGSRDEPTDKRVLQVVANGQATFFNSQVDALRDLGVTCDVLALPERAGLGNDIRSVGRYATLYKEILATEIRSDVQYDLVHANYGTVAPLAALQPTRPLVLSLWGTDLMGDIGPFVRRVSAAFDHVILPSATMEEYISQPSTTIPFGIDVETFRPIDREVARERVGWDPDKPIVLFPYSPDRPVKNYPLAEQVAREAGVEIRTVSGVDHREMPYYMNASDALLVTSERESGPMVVKEAAACNVPVVSTDVGFVSDVLGDVSNSHVCESHAGLVEHVRNVTRGRSRSDGRKHADEWSTEAMGRSILRVYADLLD